MLRDDQALTEVRVAVARGRYSLAAQIAKEALQRGARGAIFHDVIAFQLRRDGEAAQAAIELREALSLDPHNLALRQNYAYCLMDAGEPKSAQAAFEDVLSRGFDNALTHYGLGVACNQSGDVARARTAFFAALKHDPRHVASLVALAKFAVADANPAQARDLAQRALDVEPHRPEPNLILARLDLADKQLGAAERRVRSLIDQLGLARIEDQASAFIILGDVLDELGRYGEAFAAYRTGKDKFRLMGEKQFSADGRVSARDAADAIHRNFRHHPIEPPLRPLKAPSDLACEHVFLLGFPRSGTTLLEQVLASHPNVVNLQELPALAAASGDLLDQPDGYFQICTLSDENWQAMRQAYWTSVRGFGVEPSGKVFVDKMPLNTVWLPIIWALFPNAKVLFAVRDPRDVVLSCFRRAFDLNRAMYEFISLDGAARYYDTVMRAGETYRAACPLPVFEVRHETLVSDFEPELHRICEFLHLDWSDELLGFAEKARSRRIRTPSARQVVRGINSDGVGHWRRYEKALAPVRHILDPWAARFGYPET